MKWLYPLIVWFRAVEMIELHRLNETTFYLYHHLIETMERMTDNTVLTLTTEKKYIVREKPPEIIQQIQRYEGEIFQRKYFPEDDKEEKVP